MANDEKIDIYKNGLRLKGAEKRLKKSKILYKNKKYINDFIRNLTASDEISEARQAKLMDEFRKIAEKLNKPFNKATKKDIENLLIWINGNGFAPTTKKDYRQHLRRLIKWIWIQEKKIEDNGSYPLIVSWVKGEVRKEYNRNATLAKVNLTEEEVMKMIDAEQSLCWKTLLWILWEASLRIGELKNLRNKHIEASENGVTIHIEHGKTGARKLPIRKARQTLLSWINSGSGEPENLIFKMKYITIQNHLKRLAKKVGIDNKPIGTKWFRKASLTYYAQFFTTSQLQYWAGWNSIKTAQYYIGQTLKPIEDKIDEINGIMNKESEKPVIRFQTCLKCKERNDLDKKLCLKCGFPLDPEELKRYELNQEQKMRSMIQEEMAVAMQKLLIRPNSTGANMLKALDENR